MPLMVYRKLLFHPMFSIKVHVKGSPDLGEEHDMGLQQRDGDVPGVVAVAQELDQLRRDLGLRLTQRDAFQQGLHSIERILKIKAARLFCEKMCVGWKSLEDTMTLFRRSIVVWSVQALQYTAKNVAGLSATQTGSFGAPEE